MPDNSTLNQGGYLISLASGFSLEDRFVIDALVALNRAGREKTGHSGTTGKRVVCPAGILRYFLH